MQSLLHIVSDEPVDMTYLGIGSCPFPVEGILEAKHDQLIPLCFHEVMSRENKTFRIVHFDPYFQKQEVFLHQYFANFHLIPVESDEGYHWVGNHIEVYLFPMKVDHKEDYNFFHKLVHTILNTKGKLVIQEFTGYELRSLNLRLYEDVQEKEKYKRRILLDMTYGTEIGCSTDMTKAQPFYDYNGDFINLHFMKEQDIERWIGISQPLDKLLRTKFIGKFLQTLNTYHVDYRRRLKGETCMYGSPDYDHKTSPEDIMKILQIKLMQSFEILMRTKLVNKADQQKLIDLFENYKTYDPYKWYALVEKLIPRP